MTKLYMILKILTFPGAYLRGFWEQVTCGLLAIRVELPGYLRFDEACGHVEHSLAEKPFRAYWMASGAGFMNLITGVPLYMLGIINFRFMGIMPSDSMLIFILSVLSLYAGFSMLCNVFPLVEDILNFWELAYTEKNMNIFGRIVLFIPAVIIRVGALLDKYSITTLIMAAVTVIAFVA